VYLIAFSMDPQAELSLNSSVDVHSEHTMLMVEIPVLGAESGFTVPFKCTLVKVLDPAYDSRMYSSGQPLQFRNAKSVLSAQLPFASRSINLRDVKVRSDFTAGNNQDLTFSAYNVAKSRWDTLALTSGTPYQLASAHEYANPITGKVIFQISSTAPQSSGGARTTASRIQTFQVEYVGDTAGKRLSDD
jgi:hypothetical protein